MPKIGEIRKPSKMCAKWKHDKSKCYDEYKEANFDGLRDTHGKKYRVWYSRCSELVRIGNQVCGIANKVIGKKEARI